MGAKIGTLLATIALGLVLGVFAFALLVTILRMPARIRHQGVAVAVSDRPLSTTSGPLPPPAAPKAAAGAAARVAFPVEKRPLNVILITIDTLRADLGFAGYPRPVTPHIDALAERSVVYDHMYSMASFTPKSVGPMLIGHYSSETYRDYQHYTKYYPANTFVAERIQAAGGRTLAAMCHHYFRFNSGYDQGFDVWDLSSIPENASDSAPSVTSETLTDAAIGLLRPKVAADIPIRARWRARRDPTRVPDGGRPETDRFFAWFHYLDPHLPYVAHEGAPNFAAMGGAIPKERAAYDGEVWYTDKHVGRLLDHIASQPWAADTAIILTSDHGEAFGEKGHWKHGREVWEPLIHVPFILYLPGHAPQHIATRRSHVDLAPTILDLMGISPAESLPGRTLVADLDKKALEERDVYVDMPEGPYNEMRRALITGPSPGMKLIDFGKRYELYDLAEDPTEAKDLGSDKAKLKPVVDELAAFRSRLHERPHE